MPPRIHVAEIDSCELLAGSPGATGDDITGDGDGDGGNVDITE